MRIDRIQQQVDTMRSWFKLESRKFPKIFTGVVTSTSPLKAKLVGDENENSFPVVGLNSYSPSTSDIVLITEIDNTRAILGEVTDTPSGGGGVGASDLNDLSDVDILTPSDNQILQYNSTSSRWENEAFTAGASAIDDLSDVSITSPSDNQILQYNSTTSSWENETLSSGSSYYGSWTRTATINSATPFLGGTVASNITASGIVYTNADGRFTITNAGIYKIDSTLYLTGASTTPFNIDLNVNGSSVFTGNVNAHTSVDPVERTISIILNLSASDYITVTKSTSNTNGIGSTFTISTI